MRVSCYSSIVLWTVSRGDATTAGTRLSTPCRGDAPPRGAPPPAEQTDGGRLAPRALLLRLLEEDGEAAAAIRRNTATGRPTGSLEFIAGLERLLGRRLSAGKRCREPKRSVPKS